MCDVFFFYGDLINMFARLPLFIAIVALAPMFARIVIQAVLALVGVRYGGEALANAIMLVLVLMLVPVLTGDIQGAVCGTANTFDRLVTAPLQTALRALGL